MTRYEDLTSKIEANTDRLRELHPHSHEAETIRHEQTNLLTTRMNLTIGQAQEEV